MTLVKVHFERWYGPYPEGYRPEEDDYSVCYYKLNSRWFEVKSWSDFDGYESSLFARDQKEINYDPSTKPRAKCETKFTQTYQVPDDCTDPIAAIAAYKFWFSATVYAGQTGWPKGVSRVKKGADDEIKNFLT